LRSPLQLIELRPQESGTIYDDWRQIGWLGSVPQREPFLIFLPVSVRNVIWNFNTVDTANSNVCQFVHLELRI
jgi:hypothetical protein